MDDFVGDYPQSDGVSPWPWQCLHWSSFLLGTTASEYITVWRQWHDAHVVVPIVVLCTMEQACVGQKTEACAKFFIAIQRYKEKQEEDECLQMASRRFLHKRNSQEFYVPEWAIKMRWATLLEASHRTVINCAVDTKIITPQSFRCMYYYSMVLMLRVCPKRHFGDVACANIATHEVVYQCKWNEHEQFNIIAS